MKIFSFVLNNFQNDSRVLKETRSIEKFTNCKVTIFALHQTNLKSREEVGQISEVIRVSLFLNFKKLPMSIRHFLAYFEWSFKILAIIKPWLREKRILHVHDLKPLPLAVFIKLISFGDCKIIYDCHEYETEVQAYNGKPLLKKTAKLIEALCLRFVNEVICVTESIANEYVRDYRIKKPHLILNCPIYRKPSLDSKLLKIKFNIRNEQTLFLYQGGIVKGRGIEETIEAFKVLGESFVIVFLGYGDLVELVKKQSSMYGNIFYHESVSTDSLLNYTASADYGICFAPNICKSYYFSLSNKIFEYIQARIPMLVSPLYEFEKLVEGEGLGVVAKDETVNSIVESVQLIIKNDKAIYSKNLERNAAIFSWENQERVLNSIYAKYLH
jgi:glycosyltransferase involved in cell wall biosynthesis